MSDIDARTGTNNSFKGCNDAAHSGDEKCGNNQTALPPSSPQKSDDNNQTVTIAPSSESPATMQTTGVHVNPTNLWNKLRDRINKVQDLPERYAKILDLLCEYRKVATSNDTSCFADVAKVQKLEKTLKLENEITFQMSCIKSDYLSVLIEIVTMCDGWHDPNVAEGTAYLSALCPGQVAASRQSKTN